MDKTKEVEINLFKNSRLIEKCNCSKEAVIRVVSSYGNEHRYVYCCHRPGCISQAVHLATIRLFTGPRPMSLGPDKLKEAGAELIDTFKINV